MLWLILIASLSANAQDTRRVVGGDIIHVGKASHRQPEVAVFLARQNAIEAMVAECGVPHRNIVPRSVSESGGVTTATVSLDFDSCEEGKRGKGASPALIAQQKDYVRITRGEQVSEIESRILEGVRAEAQITDENVDALRKEIQALRAVKPILVPVTGDSARYQMCLSEALDLNAELQAEAPNGNFSDPSVAGLNARYERKLAQCRRLSK